MGLNHLRGLVRVGRPRVPQHELLVVAHRAKHGIMQQMPRHVLDNGRVASKHHHGVQIALTARLRVNIPQADGVIIGGAQQMTRHVLVPAETVALLAVALETQLWLTFAVRVGLGRMLRVVEYEDVT